MKSPVGKTVLPAYGPKLTAAMRVGLGLLLQAHDTAQGLGCDKWEFAYEIQALKEAGLNHNDLRSLICQGLVGHAREESHTGSKGRAYWQTSGLRLHLESCFVLSDCGLTVARQSFSLDNVTERENNEPTSGSRQIIPVWDSIRRELRLRQVVVKRFRQPAKNQETILTAFQEENWRVHIDDPLVCSQ